MNIIKKRPTRIDFTKKDEPEEKIEEVVEVKPEKPNEEKNSVSKTIQEVEPKKIEMSVKSEEIFNMGKESIIPPSKKKKKRVLSQKQLDHLARCREKALEKKRAMRQFRDKEKAEKAKVKAENKAEREAKALKKKEDNERIRQAQLEAKKKNDDDAFYARMDKWYERKTKRKQESRKTVSKSVSAKPKTVSAPQKTVSVPKPKPPATQQMKYRNEWKDPFCNSKFSPFNSTFNRKASKRGYMNY
jgi:colicin import membrane protein